MRILFLLVVVSSVAFFNTGKAQLNAIGFYDSLYVVSHPEVTKHGDSILTFYEKMTLKTLQEMEEDLARKKADYELYKDSSYRFIGCGGSMDELDEMLEYKKRVFLEDMKTLRIRFQKLTLKNLSGILVMISKRDNLAFLMDKCRNENDDEIVTPDYTNEILAELIRINNAPLVAN